MPKDDVADLVGDHGEECPRSELIPNKHGKSDVDVDALTVRPRPAIHLVRRDGDRNGKMHVEALDDVIQETLCAVLKFSEFAEVLLKDLRMRPQVVAFPKIPGPDAGVQATSETIRLVHRVINSS